MMEKENLEGNKKFDNFSKKRLELMGTAVV